MNRLVTRVEARLWLDAGNAHQAAQLLNTLTLTDLARDPEAVVRDVRERRVSRAAARDAYGVVLDHEGLVDPTATAQLRGAR